MSAVSRWAAIRSQEPSAQPNPGAGYAVGRPHGSRPEGSPMGQNNGSDWHPTVVNLLVLVFLELIGYAILRYVFQNVKGI
jgi:hypothetical protein